MKRSLRLGFLLLPALALACDVNPSKPALGSVAITTSAPTIEQGFTTTDGWAVKYTRFLVNVSAVNVAGNDEVLTASATGQLVDYVAPPTPKTLVSSDNRIARAWENVNLEVGPTTADSLPVAPLTADDRTMMTTGGLSIYVEGTITKGTEVKTLKWGFTTDTKYTRCAGLVNGAMLPGLLVPPEGRDSADVMMTGDVLFFDNLATRGHVLRGDPIAKADADKDNVVTLAELQVVTLADARATTGLYESTSGVDSLGAFISEQARSLVASFRAQGQCTVEPVVAAP